MRRGEVLSHWGSRLEQDDYITIASNGVSSYGAVIA